ncbi:hypothetical protein C206_16355 [Pseudomonas putida TRO1]|uniref:Peptidase S74 domain-containing protein n=1 Tax=Pseudomonas putida TRO1 TaxID=1227924 RepID=A0AAD2ZW31_PSEPU|nr:tail fiber domain-containing protein [Pseudomonas putida]ELS0924243.1 tail fiber domain-containing protein [Pseudomonas putida]ENY76578.1 hypothetical protein C206_16355 [Pseudomonas putida TRO1]
MELKNFFAQDDQGNVLSNATCYLFERGTENLISGLVGVTGQALSNPFSANDDGLIQFSAPNGLYELHVVKGNRRNRIPVQLTDVSDSIADANAEADRAHCEADRAESVVAEAGKFQRDDVGSVERTSKAKLADIVNAKDFGAIGDNRIHTLHENFDTLEEAQAQYPFVTSLTQSLDWAAAYAAQLTGEEVTFNDGRYWMSDELLPMDSGMWLTARGAGDAWEHLDPSIPKTNDRGVHFIFYGTGAKTRTLYGVTDMRTAGGVLDNPDSVNALDTKYALTSFHNNDASDGVESTLRKFSCGIYVKPGAQNAGIRGIRIHPSYDGIDGYNDVMRTGLGDEWDVGVFIDNAPFFTLESNQIVGYWRIKGVLQGCASRPGVQGKNFFTRITNNVIQSGLAIRGGDQSKVVATTDTTIDVPWADNHPYRNSGSINTPKGNFNYTSTSKVAGTPNGTVLRFNGVSPSPVAAALGNGPIRISSGSGLGGMSVTGNIITGLDHSSMLLASNPLIGLGISNALEISGTMRQPWFARNYMQTREDVIAHFHACDDIRMSQNQWEANDFRLVPGGPFSPVHGGRIIASPQDISNPLATASGDTSLSLYQHHSAPYVDLFPYVARTAGSKFSSSVGFFKPRRLQYPDLQMPDSDHLDVQALDTQDVRIRLAPSRSAYFQDSNNVTKVTVAHSGTISLAAAAQLNFGAAAAFINATPGYEINLRHGTEIEWQVTAAGSWVPGTDGKPNIGSAIRRVNNSFFTVAPTVSSDALLKKLRGLLSAQELAAWGSIQPKIYQMLDMVAEKGEDAARLHAGYVAQEVQQAFIDHGLDPCRYALWCEDINYRTEVQTRRAQRQKVELVTEVREIIEIRNGVPTLLSIVEDVEHLVNELVAVVDEQGYEVRDHAGHLRYASVPVMEEYDEEVEVLIEDGTRLGLRYEQCLVFDIAYLRSVCAALDTRLSAIEDAT